MHSINWGNVHPSQGDFESTTQAFVDTFVSLGQWVNESPFLCSGNILDLVFTSTINRIGDVSIHCSFLPLWALSNRF